MIYVQCQVKGIHKISKIVKQKGKLINKSSNMKIESTRENYMKRSQFKWFIYDIQWKWVIESDVQMGKELFLKELSAVCAQNSFTVWIIWWIMHVCFLWLKGFMCCWGLWDRQVFRQRNIHHLQCLSSFFFWDPFKIYCGPHLESFFIVAKLTPNEHPSPLTQYISCIWPACLFTIPTYFFYLLWIFVDCNCFLPVFSRLTGVNFKP